MRIAFARRERLGYRALRLEDKLITLHKQARKLSLAADEAQAEYREATCGGRVDPRR